MRATSPRHTATPASVVISGNLAEIIERLQVTGSANHVLRFTELQRAANARASSAQSRGSLQTEGGRFGRRSNYGSVTAVYLGTLGPIILAPFHFFVTTRVCSNSMSTSRTFSLARLSGDTAELQSESSRVSDGLVMRAA